MVDTCSGDREGRRALAVQIYCYGGGAGGEEGPHGGNLPLRVRWAGMWDLVVEISVGGKMGREDEPNDRNLPVRGELGKQERPNCRDLPLVGMVGRREGSKGRNLSLWG